MGHLTWSILTLVLLTGCTVEGERCQRFAVGISNRTIVKDYQITASSSLGPENEPYHARIGSAIGDGWCAATGGQNREYLEIDLERDYAFCGINVQGGFHGHVETFQLAFAQKEGAPFILYRGKIFNRKTQDEKDEEFYSLAPFPAGRIVRFYPVTVKGFTCARIELYGFPGPKVTCRPENVIAEFKKPLYPDLEASEMHLLNTSCLSESENDIHIIFHIPFRACGTRRIQSINYLEYSNEVIRHIKHGIITYKMNMNFPITCKYDRNVTLDDVNIEVQDEKTEAPADDGVRLQPLLRWLVTLWLIGTVLSLAECGQFC